MIPLALRWWLRRGGLEFWPDCKGCRRPCRSPRLRDSPILKVRRRR